jgi:hypothetical protein
MKDSYILQTTFEASSFYLVIKHNYNLLNRKETSHENVRKYKFPFSHKWLVQTEKKHEQFVLYYVGRLAFSEAYLIYENFPKVALIQSTQLEPNRRN